LIDLRLMQESKAEYSIEVIELGRTTEVNA
jgi:hypothetical protein